MRMSFLVFGTVVILGLIFSASAIADDLELSLVAPFQGGETENGVTTIAALLVMPCKGATKPQHPGEGDLFIVVKNISDRSIDISMRDEAPLTLIFLTPAGKDLGKKWQPIEYTVHVALPKCPGPIPFIYTLKPGAIHIYPVNLFLIHKLVDSPLDWMAVYSTNKVKIECELQEEERQRHDLRSDWISIRVQEPEPDHRDTIPEGSTVEAIPSPNAGEPPVIRSHP